MEKLFTTREAADFLHVSLRTFKYWTSANKIAPVQIGAKGAKFYSEVQLSAFRSATTRANDPCNLLEVQIAPVQPVQNTPTASKQKNGVIRMKKISDATIEHLRGISADELVLRGVIAEAPNHKGKRGYCCPLCGSGTGQNHNGRGDGAGEFDDQNRFFCHACKNADNGGHKLSTIDLFAISRNLQNKNSDCLPTLKK